MATILGSACRFPATRLRAVKTSCQGTFTATLAANERALWGIQRRFRVVTNLVNYCCGTLLRSLADGRPCRPSQLIQKPLPDADNPLGVRRSGRENLPGTANPLGVHQ